MNRFKNILMICQEDSQPELAIERVRVLAQANNAKVTLLDVVDLDRRDMASLLSSLPDRTAQEMQQQIFDYHSNRLELLANGLREDGITASKLILQGVPFIETIRAVLRSGHDIVVKGTSLDPAQKRATFLGLDMHLMRKCPCPVLVINKPVFQDQARVLAAVDPNSQAEEEDDLNRLIMDLSTSLCAAEGANLNVVHAWRIEEEKALLQSRLIQADTSEIKRFKRNKQAHRSSELDKLLEHYSDSLKDHDVHLLQGHAGDVVPKLASRLRVDLVVMGTVSRTDVGGLFIGNTAEIILGRLNCSVLAVKPPNFRTPVSASQETVRAAAVA